MMKKYLATLLALTHMTLSSADEREEDLKFRITTINLIEALVQQGVLDKEKAKNIIQEAEKKAAVLARQQRAEELKAEKCRQSQGGRGGEAGQSQGGGSGKDCKIEGGGSGQAGKGSRHGAGERAKIRIPAHGRCR